MFHKGHFVFRLLGTLLLIALLVGGGALLFRAGQAQGYTLGLAASGSQLTSPGANPAPGGAPMPFYGYGFYRPHFMPFFGPLGFLGGGLALLFFFMVTGAIFRMFAMRHFLWHAGTHGPWAGGPHGWGGHTPPWAQQPAAPKPGEPQPTAPTGDNKG